MMKNLMFGIFIAIARNAWAITDSLKAFLCSNSNKEKCAMKIIIMLMCLCVMVAFGADSVDIADSKGRTFWDKKFIRYPAKGSYSSAQITKTCNTKEYFNEVGLQTNLKDKTIIENFPMEQGEEIEIKSATLQDDKFMLK